MSRDTLSRRWAPALAGLLLLLAGCSGGGDPTTLGPVPTAPSTTVTEPPATTTTTTGAPATTTTSPRPSPTTTVRPTVVDGVPQVTATPARAAVGTRVRIEGTGFTDDRWKVREAPLWLSGSGGAGCNLFAQADHTVTVSATGRLTGEFVVPYIGHCRMGDSDDPVPVGAGRYRIVFPCTACSIGELEVTSGAARCASVGFTPNSDDVAGSVVAGGMTCAEAEALVRTVGAQVGAVGGPSRVEAGGFVCLRINQDDGARGLPSSTFECTSGSKRVRFVRT